MQELEFIETPNSLRIPGSHPGVRAIKVGGEKAHRLADFSRHAADLTFARNCISELNSALTNDTVSESLWRSAILHYAKCFASGVRTRLIPQACCGEGAPEVVEAQAFFLNLRNKHIAHDISIYSSAEVCAVVNFEGEPLKISQLLCPVRRADTLNEKSVAALSNLIELAFAAVNKERVALCESIQDDLERVAYSELLNRPEFVLTPVQGRVDKGRSPYKAE